MLDNAFLDSVREQKYHTFNGKPIISKSDLYDVDWDWITNFVDTHPRKDGDKVLRDLKPEWIGWLLLRCERRGSIPPWAKDMHSNLKKLFPDNDITIHMFGGLSDEARSFKIHRDGMDVLYVQLIGQIEWSIWKPKPNVTPQSNMDRPNCTKLYSNRFTPGRAIYVPRGTYHLVEPYMSRAGFSFGIEGKNPCTYFQDV